MADASKPRAKNVRVKLPSTNAIASFMADRPLKIIHVETSVRGLRYQSTTAIGRIRDADLIGCI
jgi:hypothetical protein